MADLDKQKVILGLSGGVDSTAACLLLQNEGYNVTGLYFDVTGKNREEEARARKSAKELGIKLIVKNVKDDFEKIVISNFCEEYINGRTPNPCIICNPNVKFKTLIDAADEEGAAYIATGHYARKEFISSQNSCCIKCAASEAKDQSYMLYRLNKEVIARLLLPLGNATGKDEIRQIARENKLHNAGAKDSQEICFLEGDYGDYIIGRGYESKPGNFVDKSGKVLGEHQGLINYTIGQRKHLGIALGKPAFVTELRGEKNEVVLGDNEDLFSDTVISTDNYFAMEPVDGETITAKIRYSIKPQPAKIKALNDGKIETVFEEPQRAITPGQSIVFYRDGLVLGGGFICQS